MQQRNTNSHKWQKKLAEENAQSKDNASESRKPDGANDGAPALDQFYSDEEPENFESQKEDMKLYLNKLNKRIDILVDAWKKAENMMSKMGDYKVLMEQVKERKEAAMNQNDQGKKEKKQNDGKSLLLQNQTMTKFLEEEILKSSK